MSKPLTLEELRESAGGRSLYVEQRWSFKLSAPMVLEQVGGMFRGFEIRILPARREIVANCYEEALYGKLWRAWTEEPKGMDRAAAWEDDSEGGRDFDEIAGDFKREAENLYKRCDEQRNTKICWDGSLIRRQRKLVKMTQETLARKTGVIQKLICAYEKGQHVPMADKLPKLAEALGCSIQDFFREDKENAETEA